MPPPGLLNDNNPVSRSEPGGGYTPGISYEYQDKGLGEFSNCNLLILNDRLLVVPASLMPTIGPKKEKNGRTSAARKIAHF